MKDQMKPHFNIKGQIILLKKWAISFYQTLNQILD